MTTLTIRLKNIAPFGIPFLLILAILILVNSPLFQMHTEIFSSAITFDLVLGIPLLYFFLIRKKKIPNITTIPFFIFGIILSSLIIPEDFQFYLTQVKYWLLPIVETTVFILVVIKMRSLKKDFKHQFNHSLDFYSALKIAAEKVLPKKISTAFATEIAVFYYAFIHWKKVQLKENEFSYHKKSGTIALLAILILMILVETTALHFLLESWSFMAAWILTGLSTYTAFQVFGLLRSMSKRPISIENGNLYLRYGLFSETTILLADIEKIERVVQSTNISKSIKRLSPLGDLEKPNIMIELKKEASFFGLYGMKSKYKTIAFYVDEKERFLDVLNQQLRDFS